MSVSSDVVVIGSCVQDLISYTTRFPRPGESHRGHAFQTGCGGKGANQAVCASRLGVKVVMVAKVGDDLFGHETIENFKTNGVDVEHVGVTKDASTATANIMVEDSGQNMIVVFLGANEHLSVEDVRRAETTIAGAKVAVCQLEVKPLVTLEALRLAHQHNVFTIFNPAPGLPDIPDEIYRYCDLVIPNENEAAILTGLEVNTEDDASLQRVVDALLAKGCRMVVITLGDKGCVMKTRGESELRWIRAEPVKAVDTVGAGDCFIGSLAYFCAKYSKIPLVDKLERSCKIATFSVLKPGTQTSYPYQQDINANLLTFSL